MLFVIFRGLLIDEMFRSSTWRELKAVYICLSSFSVVLSGRAVQWFTDNRDIPSIIRNSSMKRDLHEISLSIFHLVLRNGIDLQVDWIPRSLNEHADTISRIVDFDDWGVSFEFFRYVDNIWDPHPLIVLPKIPITANYPDSFLVSGILTRREWMPFVLTGRGRITGSFPQCPLFPGLLGICLYVGPWALLLSLTGSQLHFGPWSLVRIPPFPFPLKTPLFLPMFLIFLFLAPQSLFLKALNLSLMC